MSNAATSFKTMDAVLQSQYHEKHGVVIGRLQYMEKASDEGKIGKRPS